MIYATQPFERMALSAIIQAARQDERRKCIAIIQARIDAYKDDRDKKGEWPEYSQNAYTVASCVKYEIQDAV